MNIASGKGKLLLITAVTAAACPGKKVRITIDGLLSNELTFSDEASRYVVFGTAEADEITIVESENPALINTEFNTSLKIEYCLIGSNLALFVLYTVRIKPLAK